MADPALIVQAGYVTVLTQVGDGRAYIDIQQGQPLPADVDAEDVARLLGAGDVAYESAGADGQDVPVESGTPARRRRRDS